MAGVSMHGCQSAADMGVADGREPTGGRGAVAIDPTADEPGCQQVRHTRQNRGAAHLRLRGLHRHSRQQRTDDRVVAGHIATLDDRRHQRDQWIKRTGTQAHRAAEERACRARSLPYHFADVAPQLGHLATLEGGADDIGRTRQPMADALRQQHQIAVAQLLPSLRFGMNPAWTLADKVKPKQRLLRKFYAPRVSELAAAIVDTTQAKVLQDFTERIHRDMGRRRRLGRTVKHIADIDAERPADKRGPLFHPGSRANGTLPFLAGLPPLPPAPTACKEC